VKKRVPAPSVLRRDAHADPASGGDPSSLPAARPAAQPAPDVPVLVEGLGPHLIYDGHGCAAGRLDDLDRVFALLDSLPERIHMTKVTPPCVFRHATAGRGGDGISGFVLIAESHIAVHTFPRRHFLNVDVFSCRTFDVELALAALKETFAPRRVEWRLLDRGLEFPRAIGAARATMLQERSQVARDLGLEVSR